MPVRKKTEKLNTYVSRCISQRQKEHSDEDIKQSTAVCYDMGREFWKPKSKVGGKARKRL